MKSLLQFTLTFFLLSCLIHSGFAKNGFSPINGQILREKCSVALKVYDKTIQLSNADDTISAINDLSFCSSYINGVRDTIFMMQGVKAGIASNPNVDIPMPYCLPDNLTIEDGIKAIIRFMDSNPDSKTVHASIVIMAAFAKYFPCK